MRAIAPSLSAYRRIDSVLVGSVSGSGTDGIGSAWSTPGSGCWNDADSAKIAFPRWTPITRRVVNERPSRMRSTSYTIGMLGSPGRMK
jgi:hypothetical protein